MLLMMLLVIGATGICLHEQINQCESAGVFGHHQFGHHQFGQLSGICLIALDDFVGSAITVSDRSMCTAAIGQREFVSQRGTATQCVACAYSRIAATAGACSDTVLTRRRYCASWPMRSICPDPESSDLSSVPVSSYRGKSTVEPGAAGTPGAPGSRRRPH